jgi:hypothetical protein
MRRLPGLLVALAAVAALVAPAQASILITVDKSAQQMTVTVDGDPRYVWPVSTGMAQYDTPVGQYTPFRMEKDHFSREWDDAPMPYSIFFTKQGHAIHGTNHAIDGAAHSHGCVRISVKHAAQLWDLVKAEGMQNVRVELSGRIPGRGELMARRDPATVGDIDRAPADSSSYPKDNPHVTGDVAMSQDGSWHTYVENGQVYYYRDGPEELRREAAPRRVYHRRYHYYPRGFPFW